MPNVLISLREYRMLVARDAELEQLECIGVDNWSGYGEYDSITGGDGAQEIEDAKKKCVERVYPYPSSKKEYERLSKFDE